MVADPSYVETFTVQGKDYHRGICPACNYTGSSVSSEDLSLQLLNIHRKNRLHISTVNTAHRFHVL